LPPKSDKTSKPSPPARPTDRRGDAAEPGSAESIRGLLREAEGHLKSKGVKVTLSDYLRLLQLHREMESEESREIKVTWVEKKPDLEN